MKNLRHLFKFALLAICAFTIFSQRAKAQVSITTLGVPYTQDFDTLPASGSVTWTNNSTIPGWFHARTGTGTTLVANDGSSNAGNFYSYGTGTATDRSLGALNSGNAAIGNIFYSVRLQNNSGTTITALQVNYYGEEWRNSAAAAQTIAFSYLIGSPTVTGSLAEFQSAGVPVTQLDFTSPVTGGTAGALNGNLAANRTFIGYTITGLNIPSGTEIMLRWSDPDHTGADHGLAIDDFSVTPLAATAAAVTVSGRVADQSGRAIVRAQVRFTDAGGNARTALTNQFGYFRFDDIEAGQTYVLQAAAKGYTFSPRVISVNDDLTDLSVTANE